MWIRMSVMFHCMNILQFVYSPVEYLGCFQFGAITRNKTVRHILIQVFL